MFKKMFFKTFLGSLVLFFGVVGFSYAAGISLDDDVVDMRNCLFDKASDNGVTLKTTAEIRTFDEQYEIWKQGRCTDGAIVTNAKPGYSMHNFGFAFDVVDNEQGFDASDAEWNQIGEWGKDCGLSWGGEWNSLVDKTHFEKPGVNLSSLREEYEDELSVFDYSCADDPTVDECVDPDLGVIECPTVDECVAEGDYDSCQDCCANFHIDDYYDCEIACCNAYEDDNFFGDCESVDPTGGDTGSGTDLDTVFFDNADEDPSDNQGDIQGGLVTCRGDNCDFNTLTKMISNILKWLVWFGYAAVTLVILIAGVRLVTSGGNTSARDTAKKMLSKALIGLVVLAAAHAIVFFIVDLLVKPDSDLIRGNNLLEEVRGENYN